MIAWLITAVVLLLTAVLFRRRVGKTSTASTTSRLKLLDVIDTHAHFADKDVIQYVNDWPARNFCLADYDEATAHTALPAKRVIFVEAAVEVDEVAKEAEWVQQLADERTIEHKNQQQAGKEKQGSSIVGIIAQLPLGGGPEAIAPTLERMIKNVPLLRGVRQLLDPKPDGSKCWFNQPLFIASLELLARHGLVYELMTRTEGQFQCALEMVNKAPADLVIVMEHLGNANMTTPEEFEEWREYVQTLAARPNTIAKLSGVPERAAYPDRFDSWTKAQISPYINVVIDAFGYDRCMFGGNWFVVNLFSSYDRWAEVLLDILADRGITDEERKMLFTDTAVGVYSL